jgi:hypothetical protein
LPPSYGTRSCSASSRRPRRPSRLAHGGASGLRVRPQGCFVPVSRAAAASSSRRGPPPSRVGPPPPARIVAPGGAAAASREQRGKRRGQSHAGFG